MYKDYFRTTLLNSKGQAQGPIVFFALFKSFWLHQTSIRLHQKSLTPISFLSLYVETRCLASPPSRDAMLRREASRLYRQ